MYTSRLRMGTNSSFVIFCFNVRIFFLNREFKELVAYGCFVHGCTDLTSVVLTQLR